MISRVRERESFRLKLAAAAVASCFVSNLALANPTEKLGQTRILDSLTRNIESDPICFARSCRSLWNTAQVSRAMSVPRECSLRPTSYSPQARRLIFL